MKRLASTLYVSYVAVIVICVSAAAIYAGVSLKKNFLKELSSDMRVRAQLVRERFLLIPNEARAEECDSLCKKLGKAAAARITIIDRGGVVWGDSFADPAKMDNHGSRPEVVSALETGFGRSIRFSKTLRKMMLYVAIPVLSTDGAIGVVRVAVPEDKVTGHLYRIYTALVVGAAIAAALALVVGGLIARAIVRPLEELGRAARRFGRGESDVRVDVSSNDEIGTLARTFNEMAARLQANIDALAAERNERDAILASMKEGLITVHASGKVLQVNDAFKEMLGVKGKKLEGKMLVETVRSAGLAEFIKDAQAAADLMTTELVLHEAGRRVLSLHAVPFTGSDGARIGTLVVVRDVTKMRELEEVRRSFVANVSHELKTPITLIKGYVETLLDGALHDTKRLPEFLATVKDHADRMNSIVDDLLQLSALEAKQDVDNTALVDIVAVAGHVLSSFTDVASKKGIEVRLDTREGPVNVKANESLLEHAIANLVDNAVKYTGKGGHITLEVRRKGDKVVLSVIDDGIGIHKRHQKRIFERFYRVDKARSRKLGGTGLGLSIVKHIVTSHGGTVSVESQPGKGSTFTISLPAE